MQIAGNKCKVCERNIVLSREGKFCAHCGTAAHLACEPSGQCEVCGQPFQEEERPKSDLMRDTILPRALRPVKSAGPVLLLAALLAFLLFIAYYGFLELLASGH